MKPSRIREFMVPTWDFVKLQELRTSDEALQLALQYPRGSAASQLDRGSPEARAPPTSPRAPPGP